jgi:hypothetical protein
VSRPRRNGSPSFQIPGPHVSVKRVYMNYREAINTLMLTFGEKLKGKLGNILSPKL